MPKCDLMKEDLQEPLGKWMSHCRSRVLQEMDSWERPCFIAVHVQHICQVYALLDFVHIRLSHVDLLVD